MTAFFDAVAIPVVSAIVGTAVGAVAGAVFQPLGVLAREAFRRRQFDPKRAHYNELIEDSKWFESRVVSPFESRDWEADL
jgi:hypothetical protein